MSRAAASATRIEPRDAFPTTFAPRRRFELGLSKLRPAIRDARRLTAPEVRWESVLGEHDLVLVLAGAGSLELETGLRPFAPGSLFLLRPFVTHRYFDEPGKVERLSVRFDLAPGFPDSLPPCQRQPYDVVFSSSASLATAMNVSATEPIWHRLQQLVQLWAEDSALHRLRAEACLMDVLSRMFISEAPRPLAGETPTHAAIKRPHVIRELADYIERNLSEPLPIAKLSAISEMAPTQFKRAFRELTGETPAAFVRRARLARAADLLSQEDLSIKGVAYATGFRDASHFSRAFFAARGLWPSEYRRGLVAR